MRSKSDRVLMVLRSLNLKTYLWSVCVMMGAALISCLFFLEPDTVSAREARIVNAFEEISSSDLMLDLNVSVLTDEEAKPSDADGVYAYAPADDVKDDLSGEAFAEDGYARVIPVTIKEYEALCRIVQAEAGIEDHDGRVMISNVVNNRIGNDEFPDDIISVIEDEGQFEPVDNGSYIRAVPDHETKVAVIDSLNGMDFSKGATYFRKNGGEYWGDKEFIFRYGSHSFYR